MTGHEKYELLKKLFARGWSDKDIAIAFDARVESVRRWRRAMGKEKSESDSFLTEKRKT